MTKPARLGSLQQRVTDGVIRNLADEPLSPYEPVGNAIIKGWDGSNQSIKDVDFESTAISQCRLSNSTFDNCTFQSVVFQDCELSGTTFIGCRFLDCLLVESKASSFTSFVDCRLAGLGLARSSFDRVEFQVCRIELLDLRASEITDLRFTDCTPAAKSATVLLADTEIKKVTGVSALAARVTVQLDGELWRQFGDVLLKQAGFVMLTDSSGL